MLLFTLLSSLCFQLEITKQVCGDTAMIDFPVAALVLAGSCKSSSSHHLSFSFHNSFIHVCQTTLSFSLILGQNSWYSSAAALALFPSFYLLLF